MFFEVAVLADLGLGLAAGEALVHIDNLVTGGRSQAQLYSDLKKIVDEWKPRVIVVGWPLNMDGSESDMCAEVRQFADNLATATGKQIVYMDERLTSREAKAESGQYSDFKKHPVDAIAARLLLESWFRQPR